MFEYEDDDPGKYVEAINAGECFAIRGRAQCEITVRALGHTGVNPEMRDDIIGALKAFAYNTDDREENEVAFKYICVGDEEELRAVRSDVTFSLMMLVADPTIARDDFVAADTLLSLIQREQS